MRMIETRRWLATLFVSSALLFVTACGGGSGTGGDDGGGQEEKAGEGLHRDGGADDTNGDGRDPDHIYTIARFLLLRWNTAAPACLVCVAGAFRAGDEGVLVEKWESLRPVTGAFAHGSKLRNPSPVCLCRDRNCEGWRTDCTTKVLPCTAL